MLPHQLHTANHPPACALGSLRAYNVYHCLLKQLICNAAVHAWWQHRECESVHWNSCPSHGHQHVQSDYSQHRQALRHVWHNQRPSASQCASQRQPTTDHATK
jgi:hypothetical protein